MPRNRGRAIVPDGWTPDQPHPDPRRENFSQRLARGEQKATVYRATGTGNIGEATARTNGHRMANEEAVRARVEHLRAAELARRQDAPETMTHATVLNLMGAATTTLAAAADALERAGGSPTATAKLRSELVTHVSRIHRLDPVKDAPNCTDDDPLGRVLANLPPCSCAAPRLDQ